MNKKQAVWIIIIIIIALMVYFSGFFSLEPLKPAQKEEQPQKELLSEPDDVDKEVDTMEEKKEIAVLETSKGNIEIELNREKAPITVENFITYVKEKHYDGTVFHRVIEGFMIQGGGFTPDGNQKPTHEPIKLESQNGLKNHEGTVAMARTNQPNSATSQFFINIADNDFLDYRPGNDGYAVFGKVVSGMEVVNQIKTVETGLKSSHQDWPLEDILLTKVYLKE